MDNAAGSIRKGTTSVCRSAAWQFPEVGSFQLIADGVARWHGGDMLDAHSHTACPFVHLETTHAARSTNIHASAAVVAQRK